MTTDRTITVPTRNVEAIRTIFYENTAERAEAGLPQPYNPYIERECTAGELKRAIGAHQRPPLSYNSVHRIVTGQTHPNEPGPIAPLPRAVPVDAQPGEGTRVVAVHEVYRVGRAPAGQSGRQRTSKRDTATLVSRKVVRGTGEKGHLVETIRLVTVDADGVVVSPGTSLKVEGTVDEGNRELSKGKVLDAMCDPKLVLDGRPNGLPLDTDDGHRS